LSEGGKTILITGANGFVGSHLTEALLAKGYRVRCMVRRTSDLTFIRHLPVEWAYADLRDEESLRRTCQDVDIVCHCAALTRALDEETFFRCNTQGTETLARICLAENSGLQRFLFVSSQAAAGPSQAADDFSDESREPQPLTWYGKSKWAAEQALQRLTDRLPLTIVRPAAVFGPRDRDFYAYFQLVNLGLGLQLGRRERRISLIYVQDLINLILLSLKSSAATGQTYFGCAEPHSYREFLGAVIKALSKQPVRITIPESILTPMAWWSRIQERFTGKPALLNEQRIRDLRQPYWLCCGEKAQRELGFVAQYDLDTAVKETANWYLENDWL
jgi:nucleoside-diphosphate-sugar epimerase